MKPHMKKTQEKSVPSIIVIMGATGDLAAKKIFPSLWHLFRQGRLPSRLAVIGFARRELPQGEWKTLVRDAIAQHGGGEMDEKDFSEFFESFSYHIGTFEDERAFRSLSESIAALESKWGVCGDKLFYLAVPPSFYGTIFTNLAAVKLNVPCGGDLGWSRLLIEKPFGADLKSARELQALLSRYFKEEQIYRIDHYLFKEIVQGMENFRFSNNLFENIWDNTTIERIDIRLHEKIGVENRGSFYDGVGALRDVGQNHIPTILALLTIDYPGTGGTEAVRENRAAILESLAPWSDDSLREHTYRAQYDGYKDIKGVRPHSKTETYFTLKTGLGHPRWSGIPIYMEAGKRTGEARKEVVLSLKHPKVCHLCEVGPHRPNQIVFRLEPNDEIIIHFWTKKPGFENIIEEREFSFFLYEKQTKVQYVEEYAKILFAAMEGTQALFVSPREVEALWKFTDPVEDGWKRDLVPLSAYKPDTTPPRPAFAQEAHIEAVKTESAGEIGIIGLGKMGGNLARRLHEKKWKVVGFNKTPEATKELAAEGILPAYSLRELVDTLPKPRTVWLMVPHQAVDAVLKELVPLLENGDTVIDGGNSPYKESIRRSKELADRNIPFLDVGVSGGLEGARNGACIMIGGERETFEKVENVFRDSAVPNGYRYLGKSGAGHFVKMVHNGIEYGMMESIAEGFNLLRHAPFALSLADVADVYQQQSIVTSRLVGWLKKGFETYGEALDEVSGTAGSLGEGAWTIDAAKEFGVEAGSVEHALEARIESQKNPSYAGKLIQTMRIMFGGPRNTDITS